jgi:hypothetical protein
MKVITIIIIALLASVSAQARVHTHRHHVTMTRHSAQNAPAEPFAFLRHMFEAPQTPVQHASGAHRHVIVASAQSSSPATIVDHPAGCPAHLFCGCGAAVRVFGHPVRSLWLAANWLKFPRTTPAPGMVAARPGHVFVIEALRDNGRVLAYDANSGHGLTRIHEVSLHGFTVVNPTGGAQ